MDEIIAYLKNHPDKASEYAQIWEELLAVYPQLTSVNSQQEWQQFRRGHSGIALEEDLWIYGPASLDESIQKVITSSLEEGPEETAADSNKQKKEVKPGLSLQRIVGTVTIKRGDEEKPIVNASVSVTNTNNKRRVQSLVTDSRGHFQTKLLMPTRYLLVFRHPEFEGEEKKRVVNMKAFQPPLKILFKAPSIEPTPEDNAEDAPPPPLSAEAPLSEESSSVNPTVVVSNNAPSSDGGNAIPITERIGYSYEDSQSENAAPSNEDTSKSNPHQPHEEERLAYERHLLQEEEEREEELRRQFDEKEKSDERREAQLQEEIEAEAMHTQKKLAELDEEEQAWQRREETLTRELKGEEERERRFNQEYQQKKEQFSPEEQQRIEAQEISRRRRFHEGHEREQAKISVHKQDIVEKKQHVQAPAPRAHEVKQQIEYIRRNRLSKRSAEDVRRKEKDSHIKQRKLALGYPTFTNSPAPVAIPQHSAGLSASGSNTRSFPSSLPHNASFTKKLSTPQSSPPSSSQKIPGESKSFYEDGSTPSMQNPDSSASNQSNVDSNSSLSSNDSGFSYRRQPLQRDVTYQRSRWTNRNSSSLPRQSRMGGMNSGGGRPPRLPRRVLPFGNGFGGGGIIKGGAQLGKVVAFFAPGTPGFWGLVIALVILLLLLILLLIFSYNDKNGDVTVHVTKTGPTAVPNPESQDVTTSDPSDIKYDIKVSWTGGPSSVIVTDKLPDNTEFVNATGNYTYDEATRTVKWTITGGSGGGSKVAPDGKHACPVNAQYVEFTSYEAIKQPEMSWICEHCHDSSTFRSIDMGTYPAGGTPVVALVGGTATKFDDGRSIALEGDDGILYFYTHMAERTVPDGSSQVTMGQTLGTVAPAGQAANNGVAHLHIQGTTNGDHYHPDTYMGPLLDEWCGVSVCNGSQTSCGFD